MHTITQSKIIMEKGDRCREAMYDELMKVYCKVLGEYDIRTQTEAFERTVRHAASRFFVEPRRAYQNIYPMLRGDYSRLEQMKPLRQEMYKALYDVVMKLSQKRQFWGKSPFYIVKFAVMEPAPRFYIGIEKMRKIFRERRNKR